MSEPLVSVLMTAYNSASFISQAIESVLAQTYSNFELLIIEDGSTDDTLTIATQFCKRDIRIHVFPQIHAGIPTTRNRGIALAQGEYIAWLDSDDLARPCRLEKQVVALQDNPQLVIVGSAYQEVDDHDRPQRIHFMPKTDTLIRWQCLFHSPFVQSSVMFRRDVLLSAGVQYDPLSNEGEDFDQWSRLLQYGQGYNLSEPLVRYRIHPAQISNHHHLQMLEYAGFVSQKNLEYLGVMLEIGDVQRLRDWYYHFPARFERKDLTLAEALFEILNRFSVQPALDQGEVKRIRGRWLGRFLRAGFSYREAGWFLKFIKRLKMNDFLDIWAYLRQRGNPV